MRNETDRQSDPLYRASRPQIEAFLREARAELKDLKVRQQVLEDRIKSACMFLGESPPPDDSSRAPKTLHEALAEILRDWGNEWTEVSALASEVNKRSTYSRKDGQPLKPSQIHARIQNYPRMFEKDGSRVRLMVDKRI